MLDAVVPAASMAWRESLDQPPDLDQVFARYLEPVHRFMYSRVGNKEDAEDLTAEVFLKASRMLDQQRPEASIARWLFTVARTVLADHWRRYYREGAPLQLDEMRVGEIPGGSAPSETSSSNMQLVESLLSALPDRYRRVLELRFLQGYSIQETAKELEITPENAKVIQHRALARAVQLAEAQQ